MNKNDEMFMKIMDLSKELDDLRICRILSDHFKFKAIDLEKQKETEELKKKTISFSYIYERRINDANR